MGSIRFSQAAVLVRNSALRGGALTRGRKTPGLVAISATLLILAMVLLAPEAVASSGTLSGRLAGRKGDAGSATVAAVDPGGRIAAIAEPAASGAFALRVPAGTYVLASSAASGEDEELSGFTAPKVVRSGSRTKEHPKLKAASASAKAIFHKKSVITVTSFQFTDDSGNFTTIQQLRGLLLNDLFGPCTKAGMIFVDTTPEFVEFARQEQALSKAGRLATPFDYRPIAPEFEVLGSASFGGESFGLDITATTVGHASIPGADVKFETKTAGVDLEFVSEQIARASAQFASIVCGV